jgi:hypothetical protein
MKKGRRKRRMNARIKIENERRDWKGRVEQGGWHVLA